ncbi:flagellar filament capping protein FliD [uncultured Cohaesibacter sp.]|uniref:flagellar filament capping protein FliD n=1 Tax=uncultured Cohaesibacter sp. TaxID=1002546 RepID=UPI0029C65324|nr:flagellar filament capping protein FliD [uncultured Cohaesibacter sp.]
MTDTTTTTSSTSTSTTTTTSSTSSSTSTSSSSSDIDWDALIESAVLTKQLTADRIESKITETETEIEAYSEMQTLLQAMQDSLEDLCGSVSSLTTQDDIFSAREAYLTGSGDVEASDALVVTADAGVDIQTYELNILQLAKSHKVASESQTTSSDPLELTGTFSLKLSDADEAVEIEIDEDMSLAEIAEAINNANEDTGITATVVQVSDDEYTLVLTADDTGKDIVYETVSGTDIGQSLGLTDEDGAFANELQESQLAIIELDGIEITRSSNTIDDVIDGVTFSLYQVTGEDSSISVEISQSLSDIKTAISNLVETYNAYREWAITQQEVSSDGGASEDATLFGDSVLRSVNSSIADALSTMIDSESMALLGLSYDENNYLELDEDELNDALLNDLDQIEDLLNFQYSIDNSDLALLYRNENMPSEMTIDIEVDEDGEVTNVLVNGQSGLFEVSGTRIVGVEGTDYEGITFVYTGTENATIEFTSSAGIAEKLYQSISSYADEDDSILTDLIASLEEKVETYEEEYDEEMELVEAYRDRLTELYASYQEQISEAESTLSYLEALLDSGD